jgi:hypothetical protein
MDLIEGFFEDCGSLVKLLFGKDTPKDSSKIVEEYFNSRRNKCDKLNKETNRLVKDILVELSLKNKR